LDKHNGGDVGMGEGEAAKGDWEGIYDKEKGVWISGGNIDYAKYPE
jgi:hypothetical protein